MRNSRKAISALVATAAVAIALSGPSAALASPHDPVLFVHGWTRSASDWNTFINRLKAETTTEPWATSELKAFSYNTSTGNASIAKTINTLVNQLLTANPGKTKVDIVAHSMGSLSSRYYLKNLGGTTKVDEWVSLGGPNHGTTSANACAFFSLQCREMQPNSTFLNSLNATDETPGAVNYGTWWSSSDGIINPPTSTILSGATNTQTANISHQALLTDATVYGQVRDFIK